MILFSNIYLWKQITNIPCKPIHVVPYWCQITIEMAKSPAIWINDQSAETALQRQPFFFHHQTSDMTPLGRRSYVKYHCVHHVCWWSHVFGKSSSLFFYFFHVVSIQFIISQDFKVLLNSTQTLISVTGGYYNTYNKIDEMNRFNNIIYMKYIIIKHLHFYITQLSFMKI